MAQYHLTIKELPATERPREKLRKIGAQALSDGELLAATLAPFHRNRRYGRFLAGMAALSIIVAFGFQPVRWLVVHLPLIKAMKNGRLIFVADFALAALAGLGLTVIGENITSNAAAIKKGLPLS